MKKGGILNPAICSLLAELGQSDELLIVDAAYPLPTDGHVIDLTLTPGIPRLLDVLRAVTEELVIDAVTVPVEIKEFSPRLYQENENKIGTERFRIIPGDRGKVGAGWLPRLLWTGRKFGEAEFTDSSGGVRTPSKANEGSRSESRLETAAS